MQSQQQSPFFVPITRQLVDWHEVSPACCSLVEASSRRSDIRSALQASPQWQQYANGPLAEANTRQDVMQWACGRPSKEALSTFKSTDDIIIDETDAPEEGSVNRHLMRYSLEDDDGDISLPMDKVLSQPQSLCQIAVDSPSVL